jgi:hypothetical protein
MKKLFILSFVFLIFSSGFSQTSNDLGKSARDEIIINIPESDEGSNYPPSTAPFAFMYGSSVIQTIYLASEMGVESGVIKKIVYKYLVQTGLPAPGNDVKVYIATTTMDAFPASGHAFVPVDQFQMVYEGKAFFPQGYTNHEIVLNNPFIYTGENLVVMTFLPYTENTTRVDALSTTVTPNGRTRNQFHFEPGLTPETAAEIEASNPWAIVFLDNAIFNIQLFLDPLITLTLLEVTPEDGAIDVALDAEVSVLFNDMITANDLSGITINGNAATATVVEDKLIIDHADFEYETQYTVFVPAGAISGYDQNLTWTFTTLDKPKYHIVATAYTGGTINPNGNVEVTHGDNQTFEITPGTDYKIEDVKVNGESVGAIASYTFDHVTANATIEAYFEYLNIIEVAGSTLQIFSHNNVVTIVNENLAPVKQVEIIDIVGRVVWRGQITNVRNVITLNVTKGLYAVRIISVDHQQVTAKININ